MGWGENGLLIIFILFNRNGFEEECMFTGGGGGGGGSA